MISLAGLIEKVRNLEVGMAQLQNLAWQPDEQAMRQMARGFRLLAIVELSKSMPIDHAWRKLQEIEMGEPDPPVVMAAPASPLRGVDVGGVEANRTTQPPVFCKEGPAT